MAVKHWTRQLNFPQLGTYLNYSISETATLPCSRVCTASTQEVIQCTISLLCAKYGVDNWITLATKCDALAKSEEKSMNGKKVWEKNSVLRTHSHINSLMRRESGLNVLVCVQPHQWLLPELLNGRVALKGSLNLINFYRKAKEN